MILPIFVLTLMGVLELGYFAAVSSATSSASREAARYGSTVDDTPVEHYIDCDGIRDAARATTGPLITLTDAEIEISYDDGRDPPTVVAASCVSGMDPDTIDRWDRVVVEISYTYEPITPLLRVLIGPATIESVDRRSIVKQP
jgi:hypothetical protein